MAKLIKEPVSKMPLHAQRMLLVMKFVVDNNIKSVDTEMDFLKSINYIHTNNLSLVKKGGQSFRINHIMKCCEVYGVDANFFVLRQHLKMMRLSQKTTGLGLLKEAAQMIALELKNN